MYKEKYLKYKTKYLDLKSQLGGVDTEELQIQHTKAIEIAKQTRETADAMSKAAKLSREKAIQIYIKPIIGEVKSRIANLKQELKEIEKQLSDAISRLDEAKIRRDAIKQQEEAQTQQEEAQTQQEEAQQLEAQKQLDEAPNLPILEVFRLNDLIKKLEILISEEEDVLLFMESIEVKGIQQINESIAKLKKKINTEEEVENGNLLVNNYLIMNKKYSSHIIIYPTEIFYKNNNFISYSSNEFKKNVFVIFNQIIYNNSDDYWNFSVQQEYIKSHNIFPVGILINYLSNNIYVILKTSNDYSFLHILEFLKIWSPEKLADLNTKNIYSHFETLIYNLNECLNTIKFLIVSNSGYIHQADKVIDNIDKNRNELYKFVDFK